MKRIGEKLHTFFPFTLRDAGLTLGILALASALCFLLQTVSATDSHVPLIFVLAVLLVSLVTDGYAYGLLASVIAIFAVNYAFTYPYFAFNFSMTGYPLTFLVTFAVSIITSTLTSRVRESERLRREAEQEKLRANLLRAISHDFRTPLTAIIGAINVVLENEGTLPPEEERALLSDARGDAEWLINMVENLLSITRINSNAGTNLHTEPQAAEEVIGEALAKFRRQYPNRRVEARIPEELLLIPMDAMLIEQVILNLLINTAIHAPNATAAALELRREGDTAVFCVSDDGPGIAPELLPRLFEEGASAGARGGAEDGDRNMGIGLTVCGAIVRAHGGSMEAENLPQGGAAVRFSLPLAKNTDNLLEPAEEESYGDQAENFDR